MKRYRIKNRFRFFIAMSLLSIILVFSFCTLVVSARDSASVSLVPRYVEEGDTLWGLSREYIDKDTDIRDYICTVMELNELQTASIRPGDLIYFPRSH